MPATDGLLLVLRHGETEWSRSGQHTGRTDIALTPAGEQVARESGQVLARLLDGRGAALILVSPLQRAWRTAELAGLSPLTAEPELQEWDYGEAEGKTTAQIREQRPGWTVWTDPLGGETATDVGVRADRVLERVRPLVTAGQVAVLVGHGHQLRILTARWLELAAGAGAHLVLGAGGIGALGYEHEIPALSGWNLRA